MVQKGRIPNRLKKYRCMAGYTQRQVAEKLGMKQSNLISKWEKGLNTPGVYHLYQMAHLYNTISEELMKECWHKAGDSIHSPKGQVRIINQKEEIKTQKIKRTR